MTRLLATLAGRPADADRALLARWADGRDEAAFAELVRRHGPLVWGVCRRQLANPADAEDAFQAAFLVLARRADAVPRCVGAWLHHVAVLTCRNVRRANRRRPAVALPNDIPVSPPADRVDVDDLLNRLPERDRRALVLCHLLGYSRAEAAKELGVPEGTLSARLSRGLARLRGAETALVAAAVPAGLATAVERAVGVWELSAAGLSPVATGAASGVIRMFWVKKLTAAAVVLAAVAAGGLGVAMTLHPQPPQPKPAAAEKLPPVAGRWALFDADLGYAVGHNEGVVTLTEKAVTDVAVGGRQCPGTFDRAGPRLRFTATDPGGTLVGRYEAIQDPATPRRMVGSVWSGSSVRRLEYHWLADGAELTKPAQPQLPPARKEWLDLAIKAHHAIATATAPSRKQKPTDEQAKLIATAVVSQKTYTEAEPRLLRKLVADQPDSVHGFDAARELIRLAGRQGRDWSEKLNEDLGTPPGTVRDISKVDATPDEVRGWVAVARKYAATSGPQMEAGVVMRAAKDVLYRPDYMQLAVELAGEADKLATTVGLPVGAVQAVRNQATEWADWTAQKNPPPAGTVWTVTVRGRVTDPAGKPIPKAVVVLNQFQNTEVLLGDDSNKVTTDADGRYTATVRCRGQRRVHLTGLWAEATGFVKKADRERRPLLPGETATVDFTLPPGEKFAGVVKLPAETWAKFSGGSDKVSVWMKGPGVEEWLMLANGERFELYLPAGQYTVTMDGFGGEKMVLGPRPTGPAEHTFRPAD